MSGKKFTRDEEIKLVEYVAYNKCLYDRSHKDYKDAGAKDNVWKEIASNMEEKSGKFGCKCH
jgi:hypothetical protein